MLKIDCRDLSWKALNASVRDAVNNGETEFELFNVNGHRYIGDGIDKSIHIDIRGIPGNDLGAFMNGPYIKVFNNAQDGVGNTMNGGKVVINGDAGDVIGYGMRGGKVFIKGNVGYRTGIHMKAYKDKIPAIVIGGTAGDFLGEYMAGGIIVLLRLTNDWLGDYIGTGMHGGVMYIRGEISEKLLGKEVGIAGLDENDKKLLDNLLKEFISEFSIEIPDTPFVKLYPKSSRPYGKIYAP